MSKRIQELDAVRGLAALAVVFFHYTTRYDQKIGHISEPLFSVPWGHYGVELFFLLSGFVIFMTLDKADSGRDFIISRVSRLYPGYWAGMLSTLTTVWFLGNPYAGYHPSPLDVAINATMFQSYFPGTLFIDGAYWTLCVEVTFYTLIFGLFLTGQLKNIRLAIACLLGVGLVLHILIDGGHISAPIYLRALRVVLLSHFAPYFCGGIIFYKIFSARFMKRDAALIVLCLVAVAVMRPIADFVASAISFMMFGLLTTRKLSFLANRPLLFLGAISYSLYVVHQNIGYLIIRHATEIGIPTNAAILVAIISVIALATLITYRIERPAQRWIRGLFKASSLPSKSSPL
jgi:peptidoglycan/LPS O-acetylase OafA/YrhL